VCVRSAVSAREDEGEVGGLDAEIAPNIKLQVTSERKGLVTVRAEQDRIVTSRDAVAIFGDRGRIIGIRSIR